MKKVLIVAFHFPPQAESTGYLRSLKFCRYLPEYGWQPHVLTVHPRAYDRQDSALLAQVPESVRVHRVFALDTRRHLSIRGKYLHTLALPDRWVSWCISGIPTGLQIIRKQKCDVIFSTFPIASAVLIGWALHRFSGKPWVADLRDSMTEPDYPRDLRTWKSYRWLEQKTVDEAAQVIFTAKSAERMYLERYPSLPANRCALIPNGYDEEDFRNLVNVTTQRPGYPLRLVHMGLLYPIERDPRPFFKAVSQLRQEGKLDSSRVRFEFRASGHDSAYEPLIRAAQIEDLIHLLPPIGYREALKDCANADGLLLFQAACCNHQIPAKIFEYLRIGRPILALTSREGDTAALLGQTGGATIVDSAKWEDIYEALPGFLAAIEQQRHSKPHEAIVSSFGRKAQAKQLAGLLERLISPNVNGTK